MYASIPNTRVSNQGPRPPAQKQRTKTFLRTRLAQEPNTGDPQRSAPHPTHAAAANFFSADMFCSLPPSPFDAKSPRWQSDTLHAIVSCVGPREQAVAIDWGGNREAGAHTSHNGRGFLSTPRWDGRMFLSGVRRRGIGPVVSRISLHLHPGSAIEVRHLQFESENLSTMTCNVSTTRDEGSALHKRNKQPWTDSCAPFHVFCIHGTTISVVPPCCRSGCCNAC
ncbi:hypothetical protein EV126DRAFT_115492 [Verticillium dahliae]|nr:hypothetical protein EV126DRAFT_115492 [Verticillium dahliae]